MPWLRRRRPETAADAAPADAAAPAADAPAGSAAPTDDGTTADGGRALVPLVPAEALERTERALRMLAAQSAQIHGQLVHLEHRVDALADALVDRLDVPSHDDVRLARKESARVAAEVARLEVNVAARLDAVRAELRGLDEGDDGGDHEVDLRVLAPTDTGWAAVG